MAAPFREMQPVLAYAAAHLGEDISLGTLAAQAGLSPFHLQRVFSEAIGESPKRLTLRLRLARAAVLLLTSDDSVLDVALSCGFQSHEAFIRAFRRRFEMTPSAYRQRGFTGGTGVQAREHATLVDKIGPCIGLYHMTRQHGRTKKEDPMTYSITRKELVAQPVLVVRRRVKRSEIAATIGGSLPHVFQYAQLHGIALAGLPFTRYLESGPGLVTMEPGMRIAVSGAESTPSASPTPDGVEVRRDTLPGGPVATTTHIGSYDQLENAYAAIEQYMEAEGLVAAGAPWESYVNDPGEYPDPKDWKTDVFWPLAR